MLFRQKPYVLPVVVLLFLSLITTASAIGTRVDAERGRVAESFTVYIHSINVNHGVTSLETDKIDWYEGTQADQVFAKYEPEAAEEIGGAPDGYYIVNDSDSLSSYPIADNAAVTMQIYDHTGQPGDLDINWNENISLQKFIEQFGQNDILDLSQFPYHITVEDGEITSIVQQYIP